MRFGNQQHLTSYGRLNGSTQFATLPNALSLELVGKSKISGGCWFKYDSNASFTPTQLPAFMGIRCPTGSAAALQLSLLNINVIRFGSDEGSATISVDATLQELKYRAWNHMYASADLASGLMRIWFNGVLVRSFVNSFDSPSFIQGFGSASYLGANSVGTPSWQGWLRDFVISFAPITDEDVWELFTKGAVPANSYHWPCDDSRGAVLACYKDGNPFPAYDAALQVTTNLFSRDVPIPPRVVDLDTNHVWLDGINDYYGFSDELVYPRMQNPRILLASCWLKPTANALAGVLLLSDTSGNSAFVIQTLSTGHIQGVARSRDGGTVGSVNCSAAWAARSFIREWLHCALEVDYTAKRMRIWLNGALAGEATGIGFEDNTFQATPALGASAAYGTGAGYFPGYLGPLNLLKSNTPVTDVEIFELYAQNQLPVNFSMILSLQMPDIISPIDTGPHGFIITPVGITSPYGPKHRKYGGIGR